MLISDWCSYVCSSDLTARGRLTCDIVEALHGLLSVLSDTVSAEDEAGREILLGISGDRSELTDRLRRQFLDTGAALGAEQQRALFAVTGLYERLVWLVRNYTRTMRFATAPHRSEEHTSELQSLMRISYAVFCLKINTTKKSTKQNT